MKIHILVKRRWGRDAVCGRVNPLAIAAGIGTDYPGARALVDAGKGKALCENCRRIAEKPSVNWGRRMDGGTSENR